MYIVLVSYQIIIDILYGNGFEKRIEKVIGKKYHKHAIWIPEDYRDLYFKFRTKKEAFRAAAKARKLRTRKNELCASLLYLNEETLKEFV